MKLTLTSTSKIVAINGVPARIWEGHTESGIAVHAFITRVAVHTALDTTEFERELQEHEPPSADVADYPPRLVL